MLNFLYKSYNNLLLNLYRPEISVLFSRSKPANQDECVNESDSSPTKHPSLKSTSAVCNDSNLLCKFSGSYYCSFLTKIVHFIVNVDL